MLLKVGKSKVSGKVSLPGSKSHTMRALFIASLAAGMSEISEPLISEDASSAAAICRSFGAEIDFSNGKYKVKGFSGIPGTPDDVLDVGNSGTTLRFAVSTAALAEGYTVLTGDHQIRKRPMRQLLESLNDLGAVALSTRNNGMAPVIVKGRIKGGRTKIDSVTSQYLSSLLIHAPLFENDTEIEILSLNEAPYVEITLQWLDKTGIVYERKGLESFYIKGGQTYRPFKSAIPGDLSAATFFIVLSAISGQKIDINRFDVNDAQGDKVVLDLVESMGARVERGNCEVTIQGESLKGVKIDMNPIPDALPAMAVLGCFAEGETRLLNVPQARLKETDRIAVMCAELRKMGADIEELEDGLIVRQSTLKGAKVDGHFDHRVVMALAVAGLNAEGVTTIDTAEAMNVTFPDFAAIIEACGGDISITK